MSPNSSQKPKPRQSTKTISQLGSKNSSRKSDLFRNQHRDKLIYKESAFILSPNTPVFIYDGKPKLDDIELTELIMRILNQDIQWQKEKERENLEKRKIEMNRKFHSKVL